MDIFANPMDCKDRADAVAHIERLCKLADEKEVGFVTISTHVIRHLMETSRPEASCTKCKKTLREEVDGYLCNPCASRALL